MPVLGPKFDYSGNRTGWEKLVRLVNESPGVYDLLAPNVVRDVRSALGMPDNCECGQMNFPIVWKGHQAIYRCSVPTCNARYICHW